MDYRTGLVWQDCQHRKLLEMFAAVAEARDDERAGADAVDLLARIAEFAVGHFEIEEAYMERTAYPHRDLHVMEHEGFLNRLQGIAEEAVVADREMLAEFSGELSRWFRDHILGTDRDMAAHVRDAQIT
jgi:hemerythrin